MKRSWRLSLPLLLLNIASYCQDNISNPKLDSILRLLQKTGIDSQAVNLHYQAGASIIYENPTEAIPHFRNGMAVARALKFYPGLERCFASISLAHSLTGRYDSALIYIDTAIQYVRLTGNKERMTVCYLNKADVLTNLQDLG